jgi:nicotinamide mononucleotide adenylyltransferase
MNPKTSQDLFNKIRSQFSNIRLGDENGAATADPQGAVFFEFEFQEDADTFGSVSISLADGENMKVYYNRDLVSKIDEDSRDEWYAFLKELKDFAVEHQLRFDVRDITKNNLTKQDYENLADTNKTVNTGEMSEELTRITKLAGVEKAPVAEGLSGTSKSSFENLDKTKLIIRHKGKVDETVPGARTRQIQSLYIENEDGERFKYPLTHLAGARAMTRHVANGGRPHDEFGQHIIQTSEDIAKLNSFSRYVTNKDQLNDNAGDIIEQTKLKLENLRGYMRNLSKQSHYETASKDFKTSEEQILDDETVNKLREKFTMKNLDNRVEDALPIINKIMSELEATKQEPVNELDPGDEPIDAPIQPPVDHGAVVQSFLTDPESKLILRKDDTADKMLSRTKFTNKNTMLSSILSDIASRLLTKTGEEDRVANFASRVADEMDQENSATFKPTPDYIKNKKIAVQLAKRYIDDYKKMQSDPEFKDEVRMDPEAFNPKKHPKLDKRARGESQEFEAWAESVTNEYAKEPKDQEIEKKDKENATKLDVTKADKMMNTTAYKRMQAGDERYADKTEGMGDKIADMAQNMTRDEFMSHADELGLTPEEAAEHYEKMSGGAHAGKFEGNQFAQAVNKAKAAGMKAGDKFKVGDQEYTLKDAIELAGLQLEEFFSEEDVGSLTDQQKQGLQAVHNKFKGHVTSAGGSLPYEYLNYEIEPELYSDMIDSKEEDKAAKAFGYDSLEDVQRAMDNGEIEGDYPEDIEKYIPITMTAWAAVDSVLKDANDEQRKAARDYLLSISESAVSEDPELARIKNLAFYQ